MFYSNLLGKKIELSGRFVGSVRTCALNSLCWPKIVIFVETASCQRACHRRDIVEPAACHRRDSVVPSSRQRRASSVPPSRQRRDMRLHIRTGQCHRRATSVPASRHASTHSYGSSHASTHSGLVFFLV